MKLKILENTVEMLHQAIPKKFEGVEHFIYKYKAAGGTNLVVKF